MLLLTVVTFIQDKNRIINKSSVPLIKCTCPKPKNKTKIKIKNGIDDGV